MSTIGLSSWAVDLKDVGAIYPFQGYEMLMTILGVAFWVIWHIVQMRQEADELAEEMAADARGDKARALIDDY
jgi:hypothetical protein